MASKKPHAFTCATCGKAMQWVKDTRMQAGYIRRRRACSDYKCNGKMTTIELPHPGGVGLEDPVVMPRAKLEALVKTLQEVLKVPELDED